MRNNLTQKNSWLYEHGIYKSIIDLIFLLPVPVPVPVPVPAYLRTPAEQLPGSVAQLKHSVIKGH